MTDQKHNLKPPDRDTDAVIRDRILHRAKVLTTTIVDRFNIAVSDLSAGEHRRHRAGNRHRPQRPAPALVAGVPAPSQPTHTA
jgi:hypothetical protein